MSPSSGEMEEQLKEILRMEGISKRFGNFYANKNINLSIAEGEVHTLLGENGAGKSTLMNILIGLYQPTDGKIFFKGKEVHIESPDHAARLGIGMVHQHFMLVKAMTVFENIILGEKHSKGIFINREARRKEIIELSERYGLDIELDKLITELAVGAQQRVEILKALYHGAELLILDEPSAALTDTEVEGLFAIMRKIVNATCSTKRKATLYEFASILNETFIGFIVGRIIDSFIIGVLCYIVLKICAIPFALMISVIVGITNIIPFFGPFIGAIPSVFILMLEEPIDALYFIIIIVIIQQIDGNIIGPNIVGNAIGISSFWILISVLIGGGLFGFPGMALGVPVFAVFYRYADKLTMASLRRKDKDTTTAYYFSLEPYGIEDDEVALDTDGVKKASLFDKLKPKKGVKDNKYIYDQKGSIVDGNAEEIRRLIEREKNRE